MIYRKSCFGHRKSFGLIGSVPGLPGEVPGTIGRGVTPQGVSWAMGRDKPTLVGWNKFPLRPIRFEKEKTQGGKSFQVGRWNPTPSRIGVGLLHLQFRPNL